VLAYALGRGDAIGAQLDAARPLPADVDALWRGLRALRRPDVAAGVDVDCADGGAPLRFLVGQAAVTPGASVRLWGTPRLGERPHRPLLDALRAALGPVGLRVTEGTPWPVEVVAPSAAAMAAASPTFAVAGRESSQFASSLLLAAAALARRAGRAWVVELEDVPASAGYLELTSTWLERFGFRVARAPRRIVVDGWAEPAAPATVPGDWSSVGYLLLAAWRTGGRVIDVDLAAAHPDRAVVRVLGEIGLAVESTGPTEVAVRGTPTGGLTASGAECPDLLPTLAALACVLPGPSVLHAVEILRHKESDRFEGVRALVRAAGGRAEIAPDGSLRIEPPSAPPAALEVHSRGDHRMAMSAAILAVLTGAPLALHEPDCVSKSFPRFWDELAVAGVRRD
jgi:3-phosphoshikimate 1-carboxyvinyltransferase